MACRKIAELDKIPFASQIGQYGCDDERKSEWTQPVDEVGARPYTVRGCRVRSVSRVTITGMTG
jgi:hypothetical protein